MSEPSKLNEYHPLAGDIDIVFINTIDTLRQKEQKFYKRHYLSRRLTFIGLIFTLLATSNLLAIKILGAEPSLTLLKIFFSSLSIYALAYLLSKVSIENRLEYSTSYFALLSLQLPIIYTSDKAINLLSIELSFGLLLLTLFWLANIKFGYSKAWSRNRLAAQKAKNLYSLYKVNNDYHDLEALQDLANLIESNLENAHNSIVSDNLLFSEKLTRFANIRK